MKEINPFMCTYLALVHIFGIIGLTYITEAKWQTLVAFFVWYWIGGLGITGLHLLIPFIDLLGGAHRLWAHRSYSASFPVRVFLMLANCVANQGSIYHWARDHRVHHKFSETEAGKFLFQLLLTPKIPMMLPEVSSMLTLVGYF